MPIIRSLGGALIGAALLAVALPATATDTLIRAARLLDVLEAGRYADLVAVAGDPSTDVTLLESVPVVIKGGEIVKDAR